MTPKAMSGGSTCVGDTGNAVGGHVPAAFPRSRRRYQWSLMLAFVLFPGPAFALLITLSFQSVSGSVPLTGSGTNTATLDFGAVSAHEPLNAGVSRTVGATSYTMSTRFGIRTTHALGLLSSGYTVQARVLGAPALTWRVDGVTMSTSPATFATSQPYGAVVPHTLSFVVPLTHPAGAVTTVLEITAIAN